MTRAERLTATTGGVVGGALVMLVLHLWPHLLDPIRPH